jgi:predicted phage terminase large subunit-like protein
LQPYHDLIFRKLEALQRGEIKRLVLSLPPRHSKTELASRNLPAWVLGNDPFAQIILASYATGLARNNSRDARNLLYEASWPFPAVAVAKDKSAAEEWATAQGGGCKAAGVDAGITGFGADWLIIDDPFKGVEDAFSETARQKVWDWYSAEARTRLQPEARVIVIGTRWHQDDLIGRILAEAAEEGKSDEWEVLRLPAIAEEGDPAGRSPGEPLDPRRYPIAELEQHRRNTRTWMSLYQQDPIPDAGAIFQRDWWRFYDPAELERAGLRASHIYVDPAFGGNAGNDETAATVWGTLGGRFYWMDTFHKRVPYHQLRRELAGLYEKWHVPLVIEENGWSQILLQELRSPLPVEGAIAFPVVGYKLPGGSRSKVERARAIKTATAESVTAMVEGGMAFLPQGASWLDYALDQLSTFPAGKHDDVVDSVVMALTHMQAGTDAALGAYLQSARIVRAA